MKRFAARRNHIDAAHISRGMVRGEIALTGWLKTAVDAGSIIFDADDLYVEIDTGKGFMSCPVGWWIVRRSDGSLTGMSDKRLHQEYEMETQ